MTFVVIYDANVLYPSTIRDVLIRLAQTGLVQAKWIETMHDETFRSLRANRPDLDPARLQRTRELMNLAVRDAVVTGFEPLINSLHLPDPDDRHVHFTPTSSSWLNLVERWFRELTDKAIRRGVFHSVPELIAAIEKYLEVHNDEPRPFIWTATAESILAKVRRGRVALNQAVSQ